MNTITVYAASRTEAIARGEKRYYTARPCSRGHITFRHITGTCVACAREATMRWAHRNPGEGNRRALEWQKRNPERCREKNLRSWRKRACIPPATRPCPEYCECCNRKLEAGKKTHLDHCHSTGKFRGWLCNRCNLGIGALGDSVEGLQQALAYLMRT